MKAALEFNLPEDRESFELALHGIDYQVLSQKLWYALNRVGDEGFSVETELTEISDWAEDHGIRIF